MAKELRDPFEDQDNDGASGSSVPVVSWAGVRVGTTYTGIIVPPNPFEETKGYTLGQAWTKPPQGSTEKARPAVWPPRDHDNRKPVSAKEYARLVREFGYDNDEPDPVSRVELITISDLSDFSLMSEDAEARLKAAEVTTDNGVRRVLVDGPDLKDKINEAFDNKRPVVGSTISISIDAREPNKTKEGKTNRFTVTVTAPTAETKAKVAEYLAKAKAAAVSAESTKMENNQEDPPF